MPEEMDKNQKNYFAIIDECAREKKDLVIHNGDARHAAYLLETFFRNAVSKISIFSGKLFDGVFDNSVLNNALENFLKKSGTRVDIICQEQLTSEDFKKSVFLRTLAKFKKKVWLGDASKLDIGKLNHFSIMDDTAFRYEFDHENKRAVANFGRPDVARDLEEVFFSLKKVSEELAFPSH